MYSVVSDSLTTWFTREPAMVFREDLILVCHDSSMGLYTHTHIHEISINNCLGISVSNSPTIHTQLSQ